MENKNIIRLFVSLLLFFTIFTVTSAKAQFSEDYPTGGRLFNSEGASFIIYECSEPENKVITCRITEISIKKTGATRKNEKIHKDICRVGYYASINRKFREDNTSEVKSWVAVSKIPATCGVLPMTRFIVDESKPSKPFSWKFIRENKIEFPEKSFLNQPCTEFKQEKHVYNRTSENTHLMNCKYIEF